MSAYPVPPHDDGTEMEVRDGDEYPLVGRERTVEIGGEVVEAEAVAGWLHNGEPSYVSVRTSDGWLHCLEVDTWRNA